MQVHMKERNKVFFIRYNALIKIFNNFVLHNICSLMIFSSNDVKCYFIISLIRFSVLLTHNYSLSIPLPISKLSQKVSTELSDGTELELRYLKTN